MKRVIDAALAPVRWLAGLEHRGRMVWSLILVDATVLGLWLFVLNGFVFNRPLDQEDYATLIIVTLLSYGATLQYGLQPGRRWWWLPLKLLLGQALAAAILHKVFTGLGMNLSGRQVLKFFALHLPLQFAVRYTWLLCRHLLPHAPLETSRLILGISTSLALMSGFVTNGTIGSGDSYWYSSMLGDFILQWRAGIFPVFVGQSIHAFNGAFNPLRFAPYLHHLAGVLDTLTGRSLEFPAIQNMTMVLSMIGGGLSAYLCTAAILPRHRWTALGLAMLFPACPGVMAMVYTGDLFMSVAALPYIPWVVYGAWRTLSRENTSVVTWCVLPLCVVWYCHPPIALWLTFFVALTQLARLSRNWRDARLWREFGWGALVFLLGTGFMFVSVFSLQIPPLPVERLVIFDILKQAFPMCFFPVSYDAVALGDYQLGWSLWLVFLLALTAFAWHPRRIEGCAIGLFAFMLVLLMPIPVVVPALWRLLPDAIVNVTFLWPMQRFYVLMAVLTLLIGATGYAHFAGRRPRLATGLAFLVLPAAIYWSHFEALSFVHHGLETRLPLVESRKQLEPYNAILTRYSFNPVLKVPSYFSHGYIDPILPNRVLAPDRKQVLFENSDSVVPTDAVAPIALIADAEQSDTILELVPPLGLAPDVHYIFRIDLPPSLTNGSFIVQGDRVHREYYLPNPVVGFQLHQPSRTFGLLPTNTNWFPIWTGRPGGEVIKMRYVFAQPVPRHTGTWALLRITSFSPNQLPIKITNWMPYTATLTSPADGAWLETPRLFIPGYRAEVNGQPAETARSDDGRVMLSLQKGENRVVLRYPGSILLRGSYYLALLTLLGGCVVGVRALIRRVRAVPAAA